MRYFLFFITVLIVNSFFAQTKISGVVVDSASNKPIEFATVRLFSVLDSTVKAGVYTDEKGWFMLENISKGDYFLKISFTGYKTKSVSPIQVIGQPLNVIGEIAISIDGVQNLKEVTVSAQLDVLRAGIDKKVYNIDQDLSSRGGTAEGVLNNVPSVTVDQDGNIALRGDGNVTILIDGRPSALTGGKASSFLASIPASSIERVEIVTNPSAKYDPDGTSGIINIVLKKNKLKGFNGQVAATMATGHDDNFSTALSYRNQAVNVFGSYAFDYNRGFRNNFGYIEQTYANDSVVRLNQDRKGTDFKYGHNARLGLDWTINPQNNFSFSTSGQLGYRERTGDQINERLVDGDLLWDSWNRKSSDPVNNQNIDGSLNFTHILKKERGKWSVDAGTSFSERTENGEYQQDYSLYQNGLTLPDFSFQKLFSNSNSNVTTAQFDLEYLFPKINARLEAGVKTIYRNEELIASSERLDNGSGTFISDTLANYNFNYFENVNSAYGVFGQQLKKWKYQVGVRAEYAVQDPSLTNDATNYGKTYMNLFPSGHVRYQVKPKSEMSVSYSRRINRASSDQLNPFTNYSDPYNLRRGNPDLKPEFIDSYDLGYSWESNLINITTSVYYRKTKGVIQRIKYFYPNNTAAQTFDNVDQSQTGGLEFITTIKPYKWWRNTLSLNGNYTDISSNSSVLGFNNSGYNWSAKLVMSFEFWKKTATVQVNGNYSSPRITAQGRVIPWRSVDISAEKLVFNKKISVGLRLSDVFNTKGFHYFLDQASVFQESEFKWLTRRLYVTVSYKFGKLEISKKSSGGGGDGGDF